MSPAAQEARTIKPSARARGAGDGPSGSGASSRESTVSPKGTSAGPPAQVRHSAGTPASRGPSTPPRAPESAPKRLRRDPSRRAARPARPGRAPPHLPQDRGLQPGASGRRPGDAPVVHGTTFVERRNAFSTPNDSPPVGSGAQSPGRGQNYRTNSGYSNFEYRYYPPSEHRACSGAVNCSGTRESRLRPSCARWSYSTWRARISSVLATVQACN